MSLLDKATLWIAAIAFAVLTAFAAHKTTLMQFLSLLIMLALVVIFCVSVVRIFTRWRERRWRALIPLGACISAVLGAMIVGRMARAAIFAWALPSYEHVVSDIESGRISVSDQFNRNPAAERTARLAYAVFAQRKSNGSLFVEFLTEGGFPVKHSGYLYSSSDHLDDSFIKSRWPIASHLREHWFYVSD